MIKKLKFNSENALKNKLNVLNAIQGRFLSETETSVLMGFISFSTNNCLTMSVEITKQIKSEYGLSTSNFNTSVHRLEEKGAYKKEGKTIYLNPLYNNITETTGILIQF
jgi:hypothetical protein